MLEHRYDIRMWESCVEPNLLMVERQDPDNCIRFQTRERCALEIAAYVFKQYMYFAFSQNPLYPKGQNMKKISTLFVRAEVLPTQRDTTTTVATSLLLKAFSV